MNNISRVELEIQTALDYFRSIGATDLIHKERYYNSALKILRMFREDDLAYKTKLLALSTTQQILNQKPLSPIEDIPEVWDEPYDIGGIKRRRCKRLITLYKQVYPDGHIEYIDPSIYWCVTPRSNERFKNEVIESYFLSEYCQVKMPYTQPEKPYVFTVEQFDATWDCYHLHLTAVISVENPDGDKKHIHRWFQHNGEKCREISREELDTLLNNYIKNARNWRNRLLGREEYEN